MIDMSLQVWLTGNNNMNNQGLLGDLTQTTAPSYVDGKLGKAMSTGGYKMTAEQTSQVLNNEAISICFWVYINADTGTTSNRVNFFGTGGMGENNNRKFSLFNYPSVNDLHWYWMNDPATHEFVADTLFGVLPSYQWTHVAITYQNPNGTVYINGEKVKTFTGVSNSSTFAYETQVIHNSSYLRWNDYRIYNECISAKTVKEISKGLVCHYKLSGVGGENLIPKSRINNRGCTSFVYDEATNVYDCIAPTGSTGWGYGIVFSRGTPEIPVGIGETICFSLEVKPDIDCRWKSDVNNCVADGSITTGNDHDDVWLRTASDSNIVAGIWNKVYWTYTAKNYDLYDADSNWGIITTNATSEIHFQLRNIKVEYGSYPTPWCPNPSDALYSTLGYDDGIECDCSGYENNGTKVGDITWSGDSARYSGSYYFDSKSHYKIPCPLVSPQEFSCSFWIKPISCGGYAIVSSNYNNTPISFWLAVNCEGSGLWFFNGSYARSNKGLLSLNTWYHVCFVFNKGIITWYQNGEDAGTTDLSSKTTTLGIKDYISIGNSYTGTSWNTNYMGNISDFRIYATALSAEDINSLYNVSASIDKTGVLSAYELVEGE